MNILITGASGGLGRPLAVEFANKGHRVWGIGRTEPPARAGLGNVIYAACDTTRREDVERAHRAMQKAGFVPDIALFCAGAAFDDAGDDGFSSSRFEQNFALNLFGITLWVEQLLPVFVERKSGVFAAVSSMSAYVENHARRIGYSASRIALNKTFENLRMEYGGTGLEFIVFNMGRMGNTAGMIGTSYERAARAIAARLLSRRRTAVYNIPFGQFLLTKLASAMPKSLFTRYLRK